MDFSPVHADSVATCVQSLVQIFFTISMHSGARVKGLVSRVGGRDFASAASSLAILDALEKFAVVGVGVGAVPWG